MTNIRYDEELKKIFLFSGELAQRRRELSFKYLRQSEQKKFSAHLCTESTQRRSVSLDVFARSLFRIGRGSTCFSRPLFAPPTTSPQPLSGKNSLESVLDLLQIGSFASRLLLFCRHICLVSSNWSAAVPLLLEALTKEDVS